MVTLTPKEVERLLVIAFTLAEITKDDCSDTPEEDVERAIEIINFGGQLKSAEVAAKTILKMEGI